MKSAHFGFLRSWVRVLAPGLSGGVLIGLVLGAALVGVLDLRVAVRGGDIREADVVTVRGRRLDVSVNMDRAEACVNVTSRFLWTWAEVDGRRVRRFVPLGSTSMGTLPLADKDQRFVVSVPLPPDLPEGDWFYRSRAVDTCPGLFQFPVSTARETPDIPVQVVARPTVSPFLDAPSSAPLREEPQSAPETARPLEETRSSQETRP